jgi:hypothetical protein
VPEGHTIHRLAREHNRLLAGHPVRASSPLPAPVEPHRPGRGLPRVSWDALWPDLVALTRAGVRTGRIVTTLPADRGGGRLTAERAHYVYRPGRPARPDLRHRGARRGHGRPEPLLVPGRPGVAPT